GRVRHGRTARRARRGKPAARRPADRGIEDPSLMEAQALKVDGMVLKNSDPAYLIECLDAVRAGRNWIDPELRERIAELTANAPPERPALAPRERELIKCV